MNQLGKIALIVAMIACLGSLFFTYQLDQKKKFHLSEIARLEGELSQTQTKLASTERDLKETKSTLTATESELEKTKSTLGTTEASLKAKTQEADVLKLQLTDANKALALAEAEMASTKDALQKMREGLEKAGISDVTNIDQLRDKVVAGAEESRVLGQQLVSIRDENRSLKDRITELTTVPVNTRGTVAAVQDAWGFVVLDLGHSEKIQPNTDFLLYRDSKMVGKAVVRSVNANTSIAEIQPEYQKSTPRVGDLAVH
jgi:septal ring factor EnvC (AmiA/AmiB activator)